MPFFKVTDVRVRSTPAANQIHLLIDGLNVQDDLLLAAPAAPAATMLGIFNARRDCFWDSTAKVLVTDPHTSITGVPSPVNKGVVLGWEARVPITGPVEFQLDLAGPPPQPLASGNSAPAWAVIKVKPETAPLVLNILLSRYTHYDNGALRNADAILIT
jgi:hypothetical protein